MALIQCPDCGRTVSDTAPNCPDCGAPIATTQQKSVATPIHRPPPIALHPSKPEPARPAAPLAATGTGVESAGGWALAGVILGMVGIGLVIVAAIGDASWPAVFGAGAGIAGTALVWAARSIAARGAVVRPGASTEVRLEAGRRAIRHRAPLTALGWLVCGTATVVNVLWLAAA